MTRILLVTVGGSPEPILAAVAAHQPDEVIFLCSAPPCEAPSLPQVIGAGTPCSHTRPDGTSEQRPNLVTQLGLAGFRPDLQIVELPDPDDLQDCHRRILQCCQALSQRFSRLELCGDYSGGTKTMSAALAMALVDQGAGLSLVAGQRSNLIRIGRSEGIRAMPVATLQASRMLKSQLPLLLRSHFYDRALSALRELKASAPDGLDPVAQEAVQQLETCLPVLMLWDRFRWREALERADDTVLPEVFPALIDWWQRVVEAREWLDHTEPLVPLTGYELVQDLLLNAERRGRRGWYDDAVARLYRALELLAQTYIQLEKGISHQSFWNDEQVQRDRVEWNVNRGVSGLYWWLRQKEAPTGLGGAAGRQWFQLRDLLEARNQSLLGHGLQPVAESEWQALQSRVTNLVTQALEEVGCEQGSPPHQLPGEDLLRIPAVQQFLSPDS